MPRPKRETPWLDRRDNGAYYVYWYEPGADAKPGKTRRLSLRTRDVETAQRRYAAFLIEGVAEYGARAPATGLLTCEKALDDYLAEHVKVKCVRPESVEVRVNNLKAFFGDTAVADIDIPMCREYAKLRRSGAVGRPAINSTIAGEIDTLGTAFRHEVKWKRLAAGDVPRLETPERPGPKDRWLTLNELAALRNAADDITRAFIDVCYYTASRRAAVEQLTWFQVDLERNRIHLNPAGRRQTSKKRPVVPIDPMLKPTLLWLKEKFGKSTRVFGGGRAFYARFVKAVEAAGLKDSGVSPHTLRHSRATHLLQAGKSPWAVANLLGDRLETVVAVYGHHCPDFLAEVISPTSAADDAVIDESETSAQP